MRYPAISPDGQTIIFSYQGDLFRVPLSGGTAVALTSNDAYDFNPVWSHDGKWIAFASDRNGNFDVYLMPATGGAAQRLTWYSGPDIPSDFSPDDKSVLFTSPRTGLASNVQHPNLFTQLYSVPVSGGRAEMVVNAPTMNAVYSSKGDKILFYDWKGYEDKWRKHHTSSIARDIWLYDTKAKKFAKLTDFKGEDRDPVFAGDDNNMFYLSEESGSFNIYKRSVQPGGAAQQLTRYKKHPVRFLTRAANNRLCFGYNGEIYTMMPGSEPQKVNIDITQDRRAVPEQFVPISSGATEAALSPNGKEMVFVFRGEVFVTSVEGGITKRITNTPTQERSVSFSPDGRSILYAAERNNNWDIYKTSLTRKEEAYFYASTVLKEEAVAATPAEEFQPAYSPDGKEVAYLEERVVLRVKNLASGAVRTLVGKEHNYSYSDGDKRFAWSPDGKQLLYTISNGQGFGGEIGIVNADGKSPVKNITESGFGDFSPRWAMDGKAILWFSNRDGLTSYQGGGEADAYAMFLKQEDYDRFRMSKEDFALLKEQEEKAKKDTTVKPAAAAAEETDWSGLADRKVRLTVHSSNLSDAALSKDGEKLFYLARFENGFDLWQTETRTRETKMIGKLNARGAGMMMSSDGKSLFVLADGQLSKFDPASAKRDPVTINGEMVLNNSAEKGYIFDHAWRQVIKKFYVEDLHDTDWDFYYKEYSRFIPHISNNYDFAEMLSEMLGELNASHTGCRYNPAVTNKDATASLGLFYDEGWKGDGARVAEVMEGGPLDKAKSKLRAGHIIERIDGQAITAGMDYYQLLNRKDGKATLLSLYDPVTNTRWEETVKPIPLAQERGALLYDRWVKMRREAVDRASGGKLGYVHVRGMNDPSYRVAFEDIMGKNISKEAVIVDTRFNGGGNLHNQLADLLGGKKWAEFVPRHQVFGNEPFNKWVKPSAVLMGESNYSDAHIFPYLYKNNQTGKLIGMPVPGTGTAVWWETQIDPTLVFGIPQVGFRTMDGKYLENNQLEPDILVPNQYEMLIAGKDEQLERAVQELLETIRKKKAAPF
jgi:Tol biopolymer transport system component/C-terminal processing protease CtpA/Prc